MEVSAKIHTFAINLKIIKYEAFSNIINSFWAIFLYPIHSRAELCSLSYSLVNPNQKGNPASRSPKRPLIIDLEGHTLTVPSQVIGYTLTLEDGNGCIFTCKIESSQVTIPDGLLGEYVISIFKADSLYSGVINVD